MVIIIPAYQPDEKLVKLVNELIEKTPFRIVIVNDGSREECRPVFESVSSIDRVTLLQHEINRGKGAALKTAFQYVFSEMPEEDGVVTADADGQHLPEDILRVSNTFLSNPKALVTGSRRFTGNVPFKSMAGNSITRFVFRISTGVKVFDTQTGLRAFSVKRIPEMLALKGDRYEYEITQLLHCTRRKIEIIEVPIETIYIEDNASSHFHPLRDGWRIYKIILMFVSSSVISFLFEYVINLILLALTQNALFISLLISRILSSVLNYYMNKKMVFESNGKKSFIKYAFTAVGIFVLHYAMQYLFIDLLHAPNWLGLILAQVISYPISFYLQRKYVFTEEDTYEKEA